MVRAGARYFASYTSVWAEQQTLELLRKIFPYLTCDRIITSRDDPVIPAADLARLKQSVLTLDPTVTTAVRPQAPAATPPPARAPPRWRSSVRPSVWTASRPA